MGMFLNRIKAHISKFLGGDSGFATVVVSYLILGISAPYFILRKKDMGLETFIAETSMDNIGQIGDFFAGTMSPVLTILTIFIILKSYCTQKEEFIKTSKALTEQKLIMEEEKNITKKQSQLDIFFVILNRWLDSREKITVELPAWLCDKIAALHIINRRFFYEKNRVLKIYEFFRVLGMVFRNSSFSILWNNLEMFGNGNDNMKRVTSEILQYSAVNYFAQLYLVLVYIDEYIDDEDLKQLALYNLKMSFDLEERYMMSVITDIIDINILGEDDEKFKLLLKKYGSTLFFC